MFWASIKFKIKNNGEILHTESDNNLKKGDYVKVNILASQFNKNDTKINIIGWLVALRFFASYKSRITYWL
jgi:DNA-directed RNA polymerase subunit E'/Rpb7